MLLSASSGNAVLYCSNLSPCRSVALTRWFVKEKRSLVCPSMISQTLREKDKHEDYDFIITFFILNMKCYFVLSIKS